MDWYHLNARSLPWRETKQAYRIWISEVMLQQTQVKTVLPRYEAWFQHFPDIETLAAASEDDVLKAWEGLGYYRRARNIHAAAKLVMSEFQGRFPVKFNDVICLPGVGRSTAGAITAFCYDHEAAVLDGNVKRVLKRWYGDQELKDAALWQHAENWVSHSGDPASWNQAMMELGATLCAPKHAQCSGCPVREFCSSADSIDEMIQSKGARVPAVNVKDVHWQVDIFQCPDRGTWMQKRPDSGIWSGLWAPPIQPLADMPDRQPCYIHTLTHRRLHLYGVIRNDLPSGQGQWVDDLAKVAIPIGIQRLLEIRKAL